MRFSTLYLIPLIIASFLILTPCNEEKLGDKSNEFTGNIPKLIDSSAKIQLGIEWDYAQDFYQEKKSEISKNPSNESPKIELAQLFVKEVKMTGEHSKHPNLK